MKLLGRDIPTGALVARIEERLRTRGLPTSQKAEVPEDGVEPRVDPLSFNMHALEENADTTRALPLHTHRGGAGQVVLLAKWAFRKSCQVLINETLGRQRVFNGLVRDSYAQLSAEVIRLRREVDTLRAQAARAQQAEGARPARAPGFDSSRHPKPPPDIEYGHPSMPAHDGNSRPPKPSAAATTRPPKPPPAIDYGRPAPTPGPREQTAPTEGPPAHVPASGTPAAPTPPSRGDAGRPSKPQRPSRQARAQGPQDKPRTAATRPVRAQQKRPAKPPRPAREVPPRPEGAASPTEPAPAKRPPARRSRAKRGGPKKN
ncbi:hypothetical protein OV208_32615 [Corallococcus sp. bb12-1]|uniref:hypothetical protein n=1 Tax=Corallococcus sp. bb12-1 TaxID=2996784 RepID=UPI00226E7A9F|nr:hypothetical protein [Corallococcus sp. bb12-1]MCY1046100.1 hypothetical protein [Corallococcus sp. bb12-1]